MFLDKHRKLFEDQSHGAMNGLKYIYNFKVRDILLLSNSIHTYIERERDANYILELKHIEFTV